MRLFTAQLSRQTIEIECKPRIFQFAFPFNKEHFIINKYWQHLQHDLIPNVSAYMLIVILNEESFAAKFGAIKSKVWYKMTVNISWCYLVDYVGHGGGAVTWQLCCSGSVDLR